MMFSAVIAHLNHKRLPGVVATLLLCGLGTGLGHPALAHTPSPRPTRFEQLSQGWRLVRGQWRLFHRLGSAPARTAHTWASDQQRTARIAESAAAKPTTDVTDDLATMELFGKGVALAQGANLSLSGASAMLSNVLFSPELVKLFFVGSAGLVASGYAIAAIHDVWQTHQLTSDQRQGSAWHSAHWGNVAKNSLVALAFGLTPAAWTVTALNVLGTIGLVGGAALAWHGYRLGRAARDASLILAADDADFASAEEQAALTTWAQQVAQAWQAEMAPFAPDALTPRPHSPPDLTIVGQEQTAP